MNLLQRLTSTHRRVAVAAAALTLATTTLVASPVSAHTQAAGSPALRLVRPVVGIAATPSGHGYWRVASDGGIFTSGDARYYGSLGNLRLKQPIVGIAATPSGHGYWLVASDGGIFTFGNARFRGSLGNLRLKQPIAGIAASRSGIGYWLVAHDGGIFTFGNAHFYGSLGHLRLAQPIVGMTTTVRGHGYTLVAADGGVFTFGDARFYGSAARSCPDASTIGISSAKRATGYMITLSNARTYSFVPGGRVPSCAGGSNTSADRVALDLFSRLNSERAARGLPALGWDGALSSYAKSWSSEMARGGFRHSNISALLSDGRLSYVGENIAWAGGGSITSGRFHKMWMQSQGHRDNMMSPYYNVVGIGVYCGADGRAYATQDFGRTANRGPGAAAPSAPSSPFVRTDTGGPAC